MSEPIKNCKMCENSLAGKKYIKYEDNPYCIPCYEENYTNSCFQCNTKITGDSRDLAFKEMHWHEHCFKCSKCDGSLVDQSFLMKDEKLFCQECHENLFAKRCDKCKEVFRAGHKKYEYKGQTFHSECFICGDCKEPIATQSFVPKDDKFVCVKCFDEHYSKKCFKCTKPIKESGVTYKGETYHSECFLCEKCSKKLSGCKFTMKDEKVYCIDCYSDVFAQKCEICKKPITGLGGTKFITFENKNWHSDCFNCSKCQENLVEKGFTLKEGNIICANCNK